MKKQTAVQWLQKSLHLTFEQKMQFEGLFQQALEIEKQQIEDAYKKGRNSGQDNYGYGNDISSQQYFNETFKK